MTVFYRSTDLFSPFNAIAERFAQSAPASILAKTGAAVSFSVLGVGSAPWGAFSQGLSESGYVTSSLGVPNAGLAVCMIDILSAGSLAVFCRGATDSEAADSETTDAATDAAANDGSRAVDFDVAQTALDRAMGALRKDFTDAWSRAGGAGLKPSAVSKGLVPADFAQKDDIAVVASLEVNLAGELIGMLYLVFHPTAIRSSSSRS